jgi:phosphoserine phosphatase
VLLPFQFWNIILYLLHLVSKETMKESFFMFIRFISLDAMVARFWKKNKRKIKQWYLRQKQDADVIISASPEFLLEPVVREYLHCVLIASKIDSETGEYRGKNCRGEEKVWRFREMYPDTEIDRFYSDSYSDASLANIARQSFMVKRDHIVPWKVNKESRILINTLLNMEI